MTQKSKETLAWLKERLYEVRCMPAVNRDEWIEKSNGAITLIDKIAEVEVYATRGGYIKDCKGNVCKDGDKVQYKLNGSSEPELAKLYWNAEGDFLVQSFKEGENPYYLWEISEWKKFTRQG